MPTSRSRLVWIAYLTLCFWLLALPAANAYIDPGSGSLLLQVAVGFAMASALGVKAFWRRITGLFRRERDDDHTGTIAGGS